MKRQSSEWEKIIANEATDKGLIFKIYKQLYKSIEGKQTTESKVGKRPKQTFLQRKYTDGQQTQEKMLSIREMQSETTMRYHLTLTKMAMIKKIYKQ